MVWGGNGKDDRSPRSISGQQNGVNIYHLLSAAFGQRVAVAKVVDLDVLDEIAILLIYLCV